MIAMMLPRRPSPVDSRLRGNDGGVRENDGGVRENGVGEGMRWESSVIPKRSEESQELLAVVGV